MTRPAERYKWSSYRNYIRAGPACVPWVATDKIMASFDGDHDRYREWVEAGKGGGEKPTSPFERAVAGLVLGSEALVARVREMMDGRATTVDEPSLRGLGSARDRPLPGDIEARVLQIFSEETPRRRRALRYYALRRLDEEAARNRHLKAGLDRLAASLCAICT